MTLTCAFSNPRTKTEQPIASNIQDSESCEGDHAWAELYHCSAETYHDAFARRGPFAQVMTGFFMLALQVAGSFLDLQLNNTRDEFWRSNSFLAKYTITRPDHSLTAVIVATLAILTGILGIISCKICCSRRYAVMYPLVILTFLTLLVSPVLALRASLAIDIYDSCPRGITYREHYARLRITSDEYTNCISDLFLAWMVISCLLLLLCLVNFAVTLMLFEGHIRNLRNTMQVHSKRLSPLR